MKKQMYKFIKDHSGETFTATALARELGWKKSKKNKNFNAKSAIRLAVRCGAVVDLEVIKERPDKISKYTILL